MIDITAWLKLNYFYNWLAKMRAFAMTKSYNFKHWCFRWNCEMDDGQSIVFTVCNRIHFLKYKEHTLVYFGHPSKFKFEEAAKYVNARK